MYEIIINNVRVKIGQDISKLNPIHHLQIFTGILPVQVPLNQIGLVKSWLNVVIENLDKDAIIMYNKVIIQKDDVKKFS